VTTSSTFDVDAAIERERPRNTFRWVVTAIVLILLAWSVLGLDIKWSRLLDAPGDLWTVARLMFTNMEASDFGRLMGEMWDSIAIAWLGTMIAAVFAVPLAFLAAENLTARPVVWIVRLVLNVLRAVPEIILAIALVPILGLTPKAGVVAIGIGSIGTLGKLCSEVLEGIQPGPLEAADAVGANRVQRLRWGVLPQALPEIASFVLYRFEINIRASAVLGVIGAGGIGGVLAESLRFKDWGTAGLALIIVVVVTMMIDAVSGWVRRRLVRGSEQKVAAALLDTPVVPDAAPAPASSRG
jgi:phosphonate transport system permease protein